MSPLLADARTALSDLSPDELDVLFATAQIGPATATGLLAWIEHAADWELNRRKGFDFRLALPEEAIDPSEDPAAIDAAIALHDQFASDPQLARFFAATVDLLVGRGQQRH
jgi:hypothetical protein